MYKMSRKFGLLLLLLLFSVLLVTGCDSSVETAGESGYLKFTDESSVSRGICVLRELTCPVSDLFWTYTAQKTDGLYTEGQSSSKTALNPGPGSGDAEFVERPVKSGITAGLDGVSVGPFATGTWKIRIYGYRRYNAEEGKFEELIYEGVTSGDTTVVKGSENVIVFALTVSDGSSLSQKGTLALDMFTVTVPENMTFYGSLTEADPVDTVVKAKLWDVTSTSILIAQSTTILNEDAFSGDAVQLSKFVFETGTDGRVLNSFDAGTRQFRLLVEYQDKYTVERSLATEDPDYTYTDGIHDNGFASVGEIRQFPLVCKAGERVTLYGDLNDVADSLEDPSAFKPEGYYVAQIGDVKYTSFASAVAAYSAGDTIKLLSNIANIGSVSKDVTVNLNGCFFTGLTVPSGKTITIKPTSTGVYSFTNGTIGSISSSGSVVWLATTGGTLTINAPDDNVYHSGNAAGVTVTSVSKNVSASPFSGYHCNASSVTNFELKKGFVELMGTSVGTLNVTAASSGDAVLKGSLSSSVTTLKSKGTDITKGTLGNTSADTTGTYRVYTINGNGGKVHGTTDKEQYILYGIEGMKLQIPEFNASGRTSPPTPIFDAPTSQTGLFFQCWNTAANRSGTEYSDGSVIVVGGSDVGLYAIWEVRAIAQIKKTDGSYEQFGSIAAAMAKYGGTGYTGSIELIDNVTVGETVTPSGLVKIVPNGFSISNLTVGGSSSARLEFDIATNRIYYFYGGKIDNFNYGVDVTNLKTTGGNLQVNDANSSVEHTGTIDTVVVDNVLNNEAQGLGYRLRADVATSFEIKKGFLDIYEGVTIAKLNASGTSGIALRARTSSVVTKMFAGSTELFNVKNAAQTDASNAYKLYNLNANAGANPSSAIVSLCTIKGMRVTVPKLYEAGRTTLPETIFSPPAPNAARVPTTIQFILWNTANNADGRDCCADGGSFISQETAHITNLYAMWGSNVVGLLVYVDELSDYNSYKFYQQSGDKFTAIDPPLIGRTYAVGSNYKVVYTSTSRPAKDRYFFIHDVSWSAGGTKLATEVADYSSLLSVVSDGYQTGEDYKTDLIGKGKTATNAVLNSTETRLTSGGNSSVFGWVKAFNEAGSWGCKDWYIPSVGESYWASVYLSSWYRTYTVYTSSVVVTEAGVTSMAAAYQNTGFTKIAVTFSDTSGTNKSFAYAFRSF